MTLFNRSDIPEFFFGSNEVTHIYLAGELVWSRNLISPDYDFITVIYGDEAHIVYYKGNSLHPVIPAVIRGYPVAALEPTSFNYANTRGIVIPDGITAIY